MFKNANEVFCLFCAWRCYVRKQKEVSRISSTDFLYHVKSQAGCNGKNQRKAIEKTPRENEFNNFLGNHIEKIKVN